ncbi:MAG: asparaginase [Calditrichaeota bacterium]|nr:MAG: asparaginase [Calditrichota bacterium]
MAAVTVYRGEQVEAVHDVSIAVVNAVGELTHYYGDPNAIFMTRSSIKAFQLLPLLTTGAAEQYNFSNKQLAIMAGSHNGTNEHRDVVLSNLEAAGNTADLLQCGCHKPMYMAFSGEYPQDNEDKDFLRHNCSGKHSGFLALAKFLGDDVSDYLNPENKSQTLVREAVSAYCEYPLPETFYGTDGCSAPNFPLPLKNLAHGFVKFTQGIGQDEKEIKAVKRIREAILEYPKMVSGEKRFDYALAQSFPDNCICKVGAEAIEAVSFVNEKIGIAVKVHDGANRAMEPVVVEVLKQIRLIEDIEDYPLLKHYEVPFVKNVQKIITGKIVCDFMLKTN